VYNTNVLIMASIIRFLFVIWPLLFLLPVLISFRSGVGFFWFLKRGLVWIFALWVIWGVLAALLIYVIQTTVQLFDQRWFLMVYWGIGAVSGVVTLINLVIPYTRDLRALQRIEKLEDLIRLSPEEFENMVATYFRRQGYQVRLVGAQGDHGVDLVVFSAERKKGIVQCKRYRGSVGEPIIRDFYGAMIHEEASFGYVITTGRFTQQARAWIGDKPVYLLDGYELIDTLKHSS